MPSAVKSAPGESRNERAAMICPGVQKPHCIASWAMNESCSLSSPSFPRPSIVTTLLPWASTASMEQEQTALPSRRMEQAPHTPSSHPFFGPVRPTRSLSVSRRVSLTSASSDCDAPFTVKLTCLFHFPLKKCHPPFLWPLPLTFSGEWPLASSCMAPKPSDRLQSRAMMPPSL